MTRGPFALGLSASPSPQSRSRELLGAALEHLARAGLGIERVDLARLSAEALLGRASDRELDEALGWVLSARILVVATPVYRATYSGLLKVFFDLLPHGALAGAVVVPIATGGSAAHQLALDHGLRPLVASLGGVTVATGIYASPDQFPEGRAEPSLLARVTRAADEALELASSAPSPLRTLVTHA
jgi:FMN reductase